MIDWSNWYLNEFFSFTVFIQIGNEKVNWIIFGAQYKYVAAKNNK